MAPTVAAVGGGAAHAPSAYGVENNKNPNLYNNLVPNFGLAALPPLPSNNNDHIDAGLGRQTHDCQPTLQHFSNNNPSSHHPHHQQPVIEAGYGDPNNPQERYNFAMQDLRSVIHEMSSMKKQQEERDRRVEMEIHSLRERLSQSEERQMKLVSLLKQAMQNPQILGNLMQNIGTGRKRRIAAAESSKPSGGYGGHSSYYEDQDDKNNTGGGTQLALIPAGRGGGGGRGGPSNSYTQRIGHASGTDLGERDLVDEFTNLAMELESQVDRNRRQSTGLKNLAGNLHGGQGHHHHLSHHLDGVGGVGFTSTNSMMQPYGSGEVNMMGMNLMGGASMMGGNLNHHHHHPMNHQMQGSGGLGNGSSIPASSNHHLSGNKGVVSNHLVIEEFQTTSDNNSDNKTNDHHHRKNNKSATSSKKPPALPSIDLDILGETSSSSGQFEHRHQAKGGGNENKSSINLSDGLFDDVGDFPTPTGSARTGVAQALESIAQVMPLGGDVPPPGAGEGDRSPGGGDVMSGGIELGDVDIEDLLASPSVSSLLHGLPS